LRTAWDRGFKKVSKQPRFKKKGVSGDSFYKGTKEPKQNQELITMASVSSYRKLVGLGCTSHCQLLLFTTAQSVAKLTDGSLLLSTKQKNP